MLTNAELLQELLSIQGRVEYDTALEELIDTVEKAVADEEFESARRTDTVPDDAEDGQPTGAQYTDSFGNRYRADGSLVFNPEAPGRNLPDFDRDEAGRWESVPATCSMRYRDTL